MRTRYSFWPALLLVLASAWGLPDGAQTPTVTIAGRVMDEAGAAVANAQVSLVNLATEITRSTTTDAEGGYRFSAVPPGRYRVRATARGFSTATLEMEARLGVTERADITLRPSAPAAHKNGERKHKKAAKKDGGGNGAPAARRAPAQPMPAARAPAAAPPPPPAPAARAEPVPPPAPVAADGGSPEKHFTVVKVFYATDRRPTGRLAAARFYGGDRGDDENLALGVCEVSVPHDHRMGHLERPSIWKLQFHEDPEKHVVLLSVAPEEHDKFLQDLSGTIEASQGKEAFVFIHGYNVTFEDAARRTAQLWFDLKFDGAAILYSWPSRGGLSDYLADEATVEWTVPHLKRFLSEIAANSHASTVHLVAHSMGNRALTAALKAIAAEAPASSLPQFRQVVLTAPDIDAGVFRQLAQEIEKTAQRVTLYASSLDKALAASKKIHQYARAGESGADITVVPGMDTIDVSAVDTGLLGHSYFGEKRSVIADMYYLLKDGKPPSERSDLREQRMGDRVYWAFVP